MHEWFADEEAGAAARGTVEVVPRSTEQRVVRWGAVAEFSRSRSLTEHLSKFQLERKGQGCECKCYQTEQRNGQRKISRCASGGCWSLRK